MGIFSPSAEQIAKAQSDQNQKDRLREVQDVANRYGLHVQYISPSGIASITLPDRIDPVVEDQPYVHVEVAVDTLSGGDLRAVFQRVSGEIAGKLLDDAARPRLGALTSWALSTVQRASREDE